MTSAGISLFIALAAFMVALLTGGAVAIFIRPKIQLKRERKRLQDLSMSALGAEALDKARAAGISDHFPNAALLAHDGSWDRISLLAALDELCKQLEAEDGRTGQVGPGSWVFVYYDFGLALIHEVLTEQR
jgi:hypothetical protein